MQKVKFFIPPDQIEMSALKQIGRVTAHPKLFKHMAVMPDVHAGMDCPIGSVIPMDGVIVPSFVGVDIGCGMADGMWMCLVLGNEMERGIGGGLVCSGIGVSSID